MNTAEFKKKLGKVFSIKGFVCKGKLSDLTCCKSKYLNDQKEENNYVHFSLNPRTEIREKFVSLSVDMTAR